jgi:peptide-methionine (S)-S-oxide reductase
MTRKLISSACLACILSAFAGTSALAAEPVVPAPVPALDAPLAKVHGTAAAILSGGSFWVMQDVFQHVQGVKGAISGYTGGGAYTAHYEAVRT